MHFHQKKNKMWWNNSCIRNITQELSLLKFYLKLFDELGMCSHFFLKKIL